MSFCAFMFAFAVVLFLMTNDDWIRLSACLSDTARTVCGVSLAHLCSVMGRGQSVQLYLGYDNDEEGGEHSFPVLVPSSVYSCGDSNIVIDYLIDGVLGYIKENGGLKEMPAPTQSSHYWCDFS